MSNLTPRGLLSTFSSTNESMTDLPSPEAKFVESLESLLLSKRQEKDTKYKYMLFLWNGRKSSSLVKALAITKGYELDTLLHTAGDPLLHILFSGGVIRHKKLQRGSVLLFSDIVSTKPTEEAPASGRLTRIKKACETVYLLQWWLPQHSAKEADPQKSVLKYPRFTHAMLALNSKEKLDYFSRFEDIDGETEAEPSVDTNTNANKEPRASVKREVPKLTFAMHMQSPPAVVAEEEKQRSESAEVPEKGEEGNDDNSNEPMEDVAAPESKRQDTQKKPGFGLALPMGALKLKTREEEAQEMKKAPQDNWDPTVARNTNVREFENQSCSGQCSEIIKDFLYMGSDAVAQSKDQLKSYKITHIVNCAADYSDNYFPTEFKYKGYYLKDTVQEDIECCFYDAVDFIRSAKTSGGRVFVHCVQGISRSATLCIAYLIFDQQLTHQAAFALVQKQRPIANPNMIFNVQLIWWYMRLYQDYSSLPVSPRVFAISSHQREQPTFIVARLVRLDVFSHRAVVDGTLVRQRRGGADS